MAAKAVRYEIDAWGKRLRKLARKQDWLAKSRLNLANPLDPQNILTPQELEISELDLFRLREEFLGAGLNFDQEVVRFLANPQARFLEGEALNKIQEYAMNAVNRPSPTNSPLNLKAKNFLTNLIAPLMQWKTRMFGNFLKQLSVPARTGKPIQNLQDLMKLRTAQWALLIMLVLFPMLARR
jgi:hypothetical protein